MTIFHLSHTDLDGYSAQIISSYYAKKHFYYNANYGPEVMIKLKKIEQDLNNVASKDDVLLLITDLNLYNDECDFLEKIIARLNFFGKNVTLQLLDHHASGEEQANRYKWYFLDTKRSATKITHDFFKKKYKSKDLLPTKLDAYVNAVNAYDVWKPQDPLFEFGKVLNRYCIETKEIAANMFDVEHFLYKKYMLEASFKYIENNAFIDYDDDLIRLKKDFFSINGKKETLDNLVSSYILHLLNKNKENMTINIMDKKGILTSAIGNTSILANAFLLENLDFDFFMDVGFTGNVSLRANGNIDVAKMASKLFGGGGHPNAAGGKIKGLQETFIYANVKLQIEDKFCNQTHCKLNMLKN